MSRSFPIRPCAVFSALLFLLCGMGEAVGVHACPHHSHAAADAAEHGQAAEHAGDDTDLAPHAAGSSVPADPGGRCTCTGPCQATAPDLAGGTPSAHAPYPDSAPRVVGYTVARHPRLWFLPFFHPYANAPPPGA